MFVDRSAVVRQLLLNYTTAPQGTVTCDSCVKYLLGTTDGSEAASCSLRPERQFEAFKGASHVRCLLLTKQVIAGDDPVQEAA